MTRTDRAAATSTEPGLSLTISGLHRTLGDDPRHYVEVARIAEDVGFAQVVLADHVVMGERTDRYPYGSFPFEPDEPNVPTEKNPVGSYQRDFDVPTSWQGKDIFLQFGGVSSAFYLWINGQYVGYSEGSKTPS